METLRPLILRYSIRAKSQLLAIQEYITKEGSSAAASRVGARIREAGEVLRHFPHAGRVGKASGTREWVVWQLPYVIVYEVYLGEPGEVMILGVFHCRQDRS